MNTDIPRQYTKLTYQSEYTKPEKIAINTVIIMDQAIHKTIDNQAIIKVQTQSVNQVSTLAQTCQVGTISQTHQVVTMAQACQVSTVAQTHQVSKMIRHHYHNNGSGKSSQWFNNL